MSAPVEPTAPKRNLGAAVLRGLLGRCPACGKGAAIAFYIKPLAVCGACGEGLAPYQTADFAPYLVTALVGLIFMPLTLTLTRDGASGVGLLYVLIPAALTVAALALPRFKGAAIGLFWALDLQS
ncbi:MAG: DUF983 domain-containing protein [Alphaproteobacteria bacterium]|nr:DUF983 domain-containing protein [Alphaproteobacteria bacterium]